MNAKPYRTAEILAIGSELLTSLFTETDSLFLAERLNDFGIEVAAKTAVGDDVAAIGRRLRAALAHSDLVILTGGLGPTRDDRTVEAVARALRRRLEFRPDLLAQIEDRFRGRGIPMPEASRKQAYIVRGASPLPNANGTAPGQWLAVGRKSIIMLPGPPRELKAMFEECVAPRLEENRPGFLVRRVIRTTGWTESRVEERISDLYPDRGDMDMTILASPGQIEIHLTSFSARSRRDAERRLLSLAARLRRRLGSIIFSETGESLEDVVGRLLREKGRTLAVAESCSGGLLSHWVTNVPGSSGYFVEGVVAYSNDAKVRRLGVPASLLRAYGAVSEPVARAMAAGVRRRAGVDLGLAITGIAGPTGGTSEKPVGLVFIALAHEGGCLTVRNFFLGDRGTVKIQSARKALDIIRRHLLSMEQPEERKAK